jgi:hypothetical protein
MPLRQKKWQWISLFIKTPQMLLLRLQINDAECALLDKQAHAIRCRRAELQKMHLQMMQEARAVADPDDALRAYLKRQKIYEDTHDVIYETSIADGKELMWRKCDEVHCCHDGALNHDLGEYCYQLITNSACFYCNNCYDNDENWPPMYTDLEVEVERGRRIREALDTEFHAIFRMETFEETAARADVMEEWRYIVIGESVSIAECEHCDEPAVHLLRGARAATCLKHWPFITPTDPFCTTPDSS